MSFLVRSQILRLFGNTLTADDKSPPHKREKILQPVQMQLSKKSKAFS